MRGLKQNDVMELAKRLIDVEDYWRGARLWARLSVYNISYPSVFGRCTRYAIQVVQSIENKSRKVLYLTGIRAHSLGLTARRGELGG
jgi:hypothetical protein